MDQTVGVLGGGQLGRMLSEAASRLNISCIFLDPATDSPAKLINASSSHLHGSFSSPEHIRKLAQQVDVLTIEIEHVDAGVLSELEKEYASQGGKSGQGIKIYPSPAVITVIQDKLRQKQHLAKHGFPLADFLDLASGQPTQASSSSSQPHHSNAASGSTNLAGLLNLSTTIPTSPSTESPRPTKSQSSSKPTSETIRSAIQAFGLPLMLKSRTLAYDGKGNHVLRSDSEEDIQSAITALGNGTRPLYAERFTKFKREIAVMVVRGAEGDVKSYPAVETVHQNNICHLVHAPLMSKIPGVKEKARQIAEKAVAALGQGAVGVFGVELFELHDGSILINEIAPRPHNSGHYTIEACSTSQYENHLRAILSLPLGDCSLKVGAASMLNLLGSSSSMEPINALVQKSLSIPGTTTHLYGKAEARVGRKLGHITIVGASTAEVTDRLAPLLDTPALTPEPGFSHPHPLVSIIMGSDSDLPVMKLASTFLDQFSIPHELEIVSAHRTPELMYDFARSAAERGVRVIIAGAGGAAHLPGMVAALTSLPVVGVPVKATHLDGVDSLHSIVQMPRGVPVATVAINNATNAGLLAVRILGSADPAIQSKMDAYMKSISSEVDAKREKMLQMGWLEYK